MMMMHDDPEDEADSEAKGFGNPPFESRFRKGQSGNPAGRPKGSKNRRPGLAERFRSLMLEEAYRPIKLSKDGQEFMMPMTQVVIRKLAQAAAKGDARAQAMFLKIVSSSADDEMLIEQIAEEARDETRLKAAAEEAVEFECVIVDAKGRPTGEVYRHGENGELERVVEETP